MEILYRQFVSKSHRPDEALNVFLLFFREKKAPLFTFSLTNVFLDAILLGTMTITTVSQTLTKKLFLLLETLTEFSVNALSPIPIAAEESQNSSGIVQKVRHAKSHLCLLTRNTHEDLILPPFCMQSP